MKGSGVILRWRHPVTDDELFQLTAAQGGRATRGWWDQVRPHSLGWVTARLADGALVGFVNVAWDGGDHAFLLDTKTRPDHQHRGMGTAVVRLAAHRAPRQAFRGRDDEVPSVNDVRRLGVAVTTHDRTWRGTFTSAGEQPR